jgi:hypothetical protein
MTSVRVERYVEQVIDGQKYKGYVKLAEQQFDYELGFAIAIPDLDNAAPTNSKEEVLRRFPILVRRGESMIDLTLDEAGIFLRMVVGFAVDFYNTPQVRDTNRGHMGALLRGKGVLATFGTSATVGVTQQTSFTLPPDVREALTSPKFGCHFHD